MSPLTVPPPTAYARTLTARPRPVTEAGGRLCAVVDDLAGPLADRAAENDRAGRFAAPSVRLLEAAGVLAACAPVADGGAGLESVHDLGVLTARLAEADASVATAVFMHLALSMHFARTAAAAPTRDTPQHRWNRAIGERRMIVCSTVTEPGTSAWRPATTAVPEDGGWTVTGRKAMASLSPAATHFYTRLRAETPDGPMIGSVLIPGDLKGVDVHDSWDGHGLRGSGSGTVAFDRVRLPGDAVGYRGRWGERPGTAALGGKVRVAAPLLGVPLGIAEAAHRTALAALSGDGAGAPGRRRTGTAGTTAALAELETALASARGVLRCLLLDVDAHDADAHGPDLMRACIAAGTVVERAALSAVDLAMQLCGGRSYRAGHLLGRLARDVRATMFMRPHAPAEEWADALADLALAAAQATVVRTPEGTP
ncbi:acyl-CoA dehydrogenase family protein [Streptomyces sp. SP17BM10]|uniref:acyl-CoA dehydrogenase family protein n=1 Tax=Streptomyces sp. SP17BM10 TaxID=3002530 RepID=UPI002E775D24|nr:acyl-CoA dehydrogenase family protein [Streptomyces sp. SP17BM10]MEE1782939.1 acyl-CoA dehydrogenase family protein [Streptomyces sp. SP17BM10]